MNCGQDDASKRYCFLSVTAIGLMVCVSMVSADVASPSKSEQIKHEGRESPAAHATTLLDPFPYNAAGWGPELGNGMFVSRWAEDWTGALETGNPPRFKAMPVGSVASLTLSGEVRVRYDDRA